MIDDDPDPIEEIRATRRKIMRKCKTVEGYYQHLLNLPPAEEMIAQFKARLAKTAPKTPCSGRRAAAKAGKRPVSRRRKAAVHA